MTQNAEHISQIAQIAQLALALPTLKKVEETALRSWRWHARKGDHSPSNLKHLKDIYEAAGRAHHEAHAVIEAAATGPQLVEDVDARARISSVAQINAYENGELDEDEIIIFFQDLIDCGLVWTLQGSYGREAQGLIQSGACHRRRAKGTST